MNIHDCWNVYRFSCWAWIWKISNCVTNLWYLDLDSKNTWSTILEWFYDILNLDLWKTLGLTYWTQTDFIIAKQGCFSLHFLYKFLFICSRKDEEVCLWEDVFCVFVCMRSGSNSVGFEWWNCILSQKF